TSSCSTAQDCRAGCTWYGRWERGLLIPASSRSCGEPRRLASVPLPSHRPMPARLARKVLLIGWDAADWKVINPLMDAGLMPALQRLVERGVMGNIATLDPPFSPMLWTSIATGHTADRHGI